jgi:hypothetical protein
MEDKNIGLIAGGGSLPVIIAKEAIKNGYNVFVVGFEGFTDEGLKNIASKSEFFKLGKIQSPIDFLKNNKVNKVILIGNISHVNIFSDIRPDLRAANLLIRLKDKTPTGIFNSICEELKKDGLEPFDTSLFLKNSLAKKGIIVGKTISKNKYEDIRYGFDIAKRIAEMDIGLSVIVKDKAVIAVEAIEGTDECIKRAGEILKKGAYKNRNFSLIKVSRPNQDMRFDLPVIGIKTIENMFENGGDLIAIESDKTLIIDIENTLNKAKEKGISIIGL